MSAPAPSVIPGTRLGDFVLEGVLGQGGGGTVYAARWGHRPVALKVLREDLLPDESERRRFLAEARLLAEVNHPGVVRILGYGALPDGRPYLAMEHLEGESLAERVRRGALAPEAALALHGQLAQAVQALHDRGLVHRDIKPENVFLVQEERRAVLLDFGIAKPVDAPASTVTRQGGVRGTPAYMAPERFFGAPASPGTDIYELGVVLYAMLTGQLPWEVTEDPVARLNPRRPSALGRVLPGRVEEVLLAALSTRAESRPGSARDFVERLEEAVSQKAGTAPRRTADLGLPGAMADDGDEDRGRAKAWDGDRGGDEDGDGDRGEAKAGDEAGDEAGDRAGDAGSVQAAQGPGPDLRSRLQHDGSSGPVDPRIDVTRRLGPGLPDPGASQGDLGFCTTQATPSKPAVSFAGVTTRSRATGEYVPLPARPARGPRARGRAPLLLAAGAVALAALVLGGYIVEQRRARKGLVGDHITEPRIPAAILAGPAFDQLMWGLHPADSFLILRLHHDELRKSVLWEALRKGLGEHPSLEILARIKRRCGIDLLEGTRWLSVEISGSPADPELDAVLRGSWTRDQLESCLRGFGEGKEGGGDAKGPGDRAQEGGGSVQRLGQVSRVQLGEQFVFVAWPDPSTFMLSTRPTADPRWYRDRMAQLEPLWTRRALGRAYASLDQTDTLVLVTNEANFRAHDLLKDLPRAEGLALAARARGDLVLRAAITFGDASAASLSEGKLRARLTTLLGKEALLKLILGELRVSRRGRVVEVTFRMTESTARLVGVALASALKDGTLTLPRGKSTGTP